MSTRPELKLGETAHGKGVFTVHRIHHGDRVLKLGGMAVSRAALPVPYEGEEDRFLQIGPETYLGASGGFDDFVNHSCEPNTGIRFGEPELWLIALREIEPGEEICFDYSTTMAEDDWEIGCGCGSGRCRGAIRDFKHLPEKIRAEYIAAGIVPDYAIRSCFPKPR